jgi:hemerythrin HHE cation binding domain-containing protein
MGRLEEMRHAHGRLDELLGRFLAATEARELAPAREAIAAFDEELRRHTAHEEEEVLPRAAGHRLAPAEVETPEARLGRELRLEHVQIRELSGVMRRLAETGDLEQARRLFGNLARRWDAHTAKEERELPSGG